MAIKSIIFFNKIYPIPRDGFRDHAQCNLTGSHVQKCPAQGLMLWEGHLETLPALAHHHCHPTFALFRSGVPPIVSETGRAAVPSVSDSMGCPPSQ